MSRLHYAIVQTITVLAAVVVACAAPRPRAKDKESTRPPHPEAVAAAVGPAARVVARQEGASFLTEIRFSRESFSLTAEVQRQLIRAVEKALAAGRIEKINLIVWADAEYPSSARRALSRDQIRLADRRAKAINDFLKAHSLGAVTDAYNMAERPGVLQTLLPTGDLRIKRTLEAAARSTASLDGGYATKAVVLFRTSN